MRLKTTAMLCGAVAAAILGNSLTASAAPIAGFNVATNADGTPVSNTFIYNPAVLNGDGSVNTAGQLFSTLLTNPADGAIGKITSGDFSPLPVPVNFHYDIANSTGLVNVDIPATLQFLYYSGGTTSTSVGPLGNDLNTPLFNGAIVITASAAVGGTPIVIGSNLLTVGANSDLPSTGNLEGFQFSSTGASRGIQSNGDSVSFSSDFLDFTNATNQNWNLNLNTITPALDIMPLTPVTTPALVGDRTLDAAPLQGTPTGTLNPFTAAGNGTFAADFSTVPEPASLAVLGLGGVGLLLKKRKKAL